MKTLFLILIISGFFSGYASSQNDREAQRVLEEFSSKALGAPSISMGFDIITTDQVEKTSDTLPGSIILRGDNYRLNMPDNTVWHNGETSWSYLIAEEEVTITTADPEDDSFQNRPSSIFSLYKEGFKNRLIEERPEQYIIDLYPEDINTNIVRVRLSISRPASDLLELEYKRKDGIILTLKVDKYDLTLIPDPDIFIFRPGEHKGAEIIDMR